MVGLWNYGRSWSASCFQVWPESLSLGTQTAQPEHGALELLFRDSCICWTPVVSSSGLHSRQTILPAGSLTQRTTDNLIECRL